jgi:hypothetical protein
MTVEQQAKLFEEFTQPISFRSIQKHEDGDQPN